MIKAAVAELYAYNYWANALILKQNAKVTPDQFIAPTKYSGGSLHKTLVHTLTAEWLWRTRIQGMSPTAFLSAGDFPTLASIETRWQEEEAKMRAFITALTDEALQERISYTTTTGVSYQHPLWQLLQHIVLHGMQHRAEMAAMLTEYGHSPGNIDLIVYLRAQES